MSPHTGARAGRRAGPGRNTARRCAWPIPSRPSRLRQPQAAAPALPESLAAYRQVAGNHGGDRAVYLTFDDGPGPQTPAVLDALAAAGVRATFCLVGNRVAGYAAVAQRVIAEGHTLCNHSWDHRLRLGTADPAVIDSEIDRATADFRCRRWFRRVLAGTGWRLRIHRHPAAGGAVAGRGAARLGGGPAGLAQARRRRHRVQRAVGGVPRRPRAAARCRRHRPGPDGGRAAPPHRRPARRRVRHPAAARGWASNRTGPSESAASRRRRPRSCSPSGCPADGATGNCGPAPGTATSPTDRTSRNWLSGCRPPPRWARPGGACGVATSRWGRRGRPDRPTGHRWCCAGRR